MTLIALLVSFFNTFTTDGAKQHPILPLEESRDLLQWYRVNQTMLQQELITRTVPGKNFLGPPTWPTASAIYSVLLKHISIRVCLSTYLCIFWRVFIHIPVCQGSDHSLYQTSILLHLCEFWIIHNKSNRNVLWLRHTVLISIFLYLFQEDLTGL